MRARLSLLLVAALVAAAGCDISGGSDPAPHPDAEPPPSPAAGGQLIVGVYGEPATFDPYSPVASDLTHALARPLYRGLYRFDRDGEPKPDLARRMRVSGDLATIVLEEAEWSDGRSITSRDVVSSLERAGSQGLIPLESARARGANKVVLSGRVEDWEEALASASLVLPADGRRAYSGPFMLRSMVDGLQIVMVGNPSAEEPPLLDRLTIRFTEGTDMLLALLRAGDLDAAAVPSTVNLEQRLSGSGLAHHSALDRELVYLDLTDSDLDLRRRRLVARALDRAHIAEAFVRDDGRISDTLDPAPGGEGADGPYEALFRGGAKADGVPVRLAAPSGDELLELVQRLGQVQLSTAGFDVELINVDARRFYGDWGRAAPVDGALRRTIALPGGREPAPRSALALPLFQVESVLVWREGAGGLTAGGADGPFGFAHEWHVLP